MFLTLDGVMEAPDQWSMPFWNEGIANVKLDELKASDALLLGRVTYEDFAAAWPSQTDEEGFADRMNSLPKYVVSTTLKKADWNNSHVISSDIPREIARLKQETGGDLMVAGSAALVASLMKEDLVDVFRLLVYPVVRGSGKRLFKEGSQASLKLRESRPFGSGVVLMEYDVEKEK
jgi:dihydrofolate reductase